MLETLNNIDHQLFYIVNVGLSNVLFDHIMPIVRNKYIWVPLYLFGGFFVLMNYKKDGWKIAGITILLMITSDQLISTVLKHQFNRERPCNDMVVSNPYNKPKMHMLVDCGSGLSMPSSHASNHFAIAAFIGFLFYKKNKHLLPATLLWALLICFAQVYVGLHYPFDILVGGVIGFSLGTIAALICMRLVSSSFYAPVLAAPPRRKRRSHLIDFEKFISPDDRRDTL